MNFPVPDRFLRKMRAGEFARVVALGSSNTERRLSGMHWFDCLELACRERIGANLLCIQSGWGGNTTSNLLDRLERDCLCHQPDLVLVTIGGNDANPVSQITPDVFRNNLGEVLTRICKAGAEPLLQTYYAFDIDAMDPAFGTGFLARMEEVREIAGTCRCPLIDHLVRWERLRKNLPEIYRRLMADPAHVNAAGNLLLGVDLVRAFGLQLPDDPFFREALTLQALLDQLEKVEALGV